jgi:hypothetical protein
MSLFRKLKEIFIYPVIISLGHRKMRRHFTEEPIFIGGCGRSGTTLLLSMISAHQDVFAVPVETAAFNIWPEGKKYPRNYHRLCRNMILNAIPPKAKRWLEKTPANVLNFDKINDFYNGKVKFIHIVRDGRDVTTSVHPKDPDRFWVPIDRWVLTVNKGLDMRSHPNVLTIKYEALTHETEETVRKICAFLSLDYSQDIMDWTKNTKIKKDPAWFGKVKQVHSDSSGRWKDDKFRDHIEKFHNTPEAVATLERAGYPLPDEKEE